MQLSPNLSVSAHPQLVEGLFVKKGPPTMTQTTAISLNSPAIQLQPSRQNPPTIRQNPNPTHICMTGNDRI